MPGRMTANAKFGRKEKETKVNVAHHAQTYADRPPAPSIGIGFNGKGWGCMVEFLDMAKFGNQAIPISDQEDM